MDKWGQDPPGFPPVSRLVQKLPPNPWWPEALATISDLRTARAICLSEKPRHLAWCSRSWGKGCPRCCSSSWAWVTMRFIRCRNQQSMRVSSYRRSTE